MPFHFLRRPMYIFFCFFWGGGLTVERISSIAPRLSQDKLFSVRDVSWLCRRVVWWGDSHVCWHLHYLGPCDEWCADRSHDGAAIRALAKQHTGPCVVGWGVHRGRGYSTMQRECVD